MSSPISTILANLRHTVNILRSAVYAIDVRDDIADAIDDSADAIEQIYGDVNSASLREDAFAAALQEAIDDNLLPIPATVIDDNSLPGSKIQNASIPLSKLAEPVQITVDSALSDSSTNPVQNKVIKGAIDELNGSLADVEALASWTEISTDGYVIHPYENAQSVKVSSEQSTTLTVRGITVADFDHMGTPVDTYDGLEEVSGYTGSGKKYRIRRKTTDRADASAGNLYVIEGTATGLEVGKKYKVCLKTTDPTLDLTGGGKYARVVCKNTAQTRINQEYVTNPEHAFCSATFTATRTSEVIRIYPFSSNNSNNYIPDVGDETIIEDFYINEVTDDIVTYSHEEVFSSTITGTKLIYGVNGRKFVASGGNVSIAERASKILTVNGLSPDVGGNVLCKSHLQGKTLVCLGDSITEAGGEAQNYTSYPVMISDITGMTVYNFGVGTTRMSLTSDNKPVDGASFATLADQINSGNWSILTALSTNTSFGKYSRVANILPTIKSLDWNTVDYVLVSFGVNDSYDADIDNSQDKYDKYAIVSAFRYGYEKIMSRYPHLRFIVLTPIYRHFTGDADTDDGQLSTGYYLYEVGEALMECCEKEYHIPSIDMYNLCGFNKLNYDRYLISDGLHPTYYGQVEMGRVASAQIMSKL